MAKEKILTKEEIQKSQTNYKGNSTQDLVKVKIIKANKYYKVGDEDLVHPTTAEILKAKGLIEGYEKVTRTDHAAELEAKLEEYKAELVS